MFMKKKILFVSPSLKIGGIENALINMLEHFDYEKFDVYVFVFHHDEKQVSRLDKRVHILKGGPLLNIIAMTMNDARAKGMGTALIRAVLAVLCKALGSKPVFSFIYLFEGKIKEMDIAVSYSNNVNTNSTYYGSNLFVLKKVKAPKKLAWLHVDYDAMEMDNDINNCEYRAFDGVVAVSDAVKDAFLKCNPEMKDKTYTVYNVLPKAFNSGAVAAIEKNKQTIVTVGRLDPNKNQLQCLEIAKKLVADGIDFKWYLVGDGQQRIEVEEKIIRKHLEGIVEVTGYTLDVNKYLSGADIFVSTSLSESYGMSVVEAQAMGLPVVVKSYPAAKEIVDGTNGILVKDYEEMYQQIKMLLTDKDKYEELKKNTKVLQKDEESMKALYEMIGNI